MMMAGLMEHLDVQEDVPGPDVEFTGIAVTGVAWYCARHAADYGFLAVTVGSLLLAAGGVIWGKFCRREIK
jgi:hypothetical protein